MGLTQARTCFHTAGNHGVFYSTAAAYLYEGYDRRSIPLGMSMWDSSNVATRWPVLAIDRSGPAVLCAISSMLDTGSYVTRVLKFSENTRDVEQLLFLPEIAPEAARLYAMAVDEQRHYLYMAYWDSSGTSSTRFAVANLNTGANLSNPSVPPLPYTANYRSLVADTDTGDLYAAKPGCIVRWAFGSKEWVRFAGCQPCHATQSCTQELGWGDGGPAVDADLGFYSTDGSSNADYPVSIAIHGGRLFYLSGDAQTRTTNVLRRLRAIELDCRVPP